MPDQPLQLVEADAAVAGLMVFATFESETDYDYLGSRAQQPMLNFRVRDLDAMLAQLHSQRSDVAEEQQDMDGVGRFGWVADPEGNRVELWQPFGEPYAPRGLTPVRGAY